ncbi:MAG: PQQ-binding-like beta-propeller repeat protein, partial [Planctomycetes bacterium]|nr:PQQ-binding-like beta-propeller repeat protein [Planctomycetota bacterium]
PKTVDPDGIWKWMAIEDGVLYAVVGEKEKLDKVLRGKRTDPGWPWRGLGRGYAAKYSWGFGRTLLSMDLQARKILWTYRSHEPIDSRAVCMANGRIFVYSHQNYLAAIDASSGHEIWKSEDPRALAAIGEHDRAQTASKGFASSVYAKANDKGVFFAGPQRTSLVAISATDGGLLWHYPHGNFQLILRDDALYAMGRMQTSKKLDYLTGEILADLDCYRGNCTRATGTADSIFTRGYRHTGTMRLDLQSGAVEARRIPLMRPACQDGVIVNEGQLYWGPWMCDCNHSLVGLISLAPAGSFDFAQAASDDRLESWEIGRPEALSSTEADWTSYRAGPQRLASSPVSIPQRAWSMWNVEGSKVEPTAPVTACGLIVWGARDGSVRACDAKTGAARWTTYTGGAIRFPPEIADGRVYVGSGDGWVYCLVMATGERLWRFRAAPAERKIAIHGRLLSTWPVGSGVLVADGVVYAAAGIASYDGTHVYALDAESGKIRWQNNTSGRLVREDLVTGVSVQGHLLLHEDRLYLAGGNIVSPAMYKLSDGACLNEIDNEWLREPSTTERFPSRPKGSMFQRSPRGRALFLVAGKVRVFDDLLYSPPRYQRAGYFSGRFLQASRGDVVIRGNVEKLMRIAP